MYSIYEIIRLIGWMFLYFLSFFILIKFGIVSFYKTVVNKKDKLKMKVEKKWRFRGVVTCSIIVGIVSIFPFEGSFMTFDNIESALKYSDSKFNMKNYYIIDADDCYFVHNKKGFDHTAYKYNDRVGLLNYDRVLYPYRAVFYSVNDGSNSILCDATYNRQADKTCYIHDISFLKNEAKEYNITLDGEKFQRIDYKEGVSAVYQIVTNGYFKKPLTITVNDAPLTMDFLFKLPFD